MKRLLVLFVALAAAVALAGLFLPSDAATVGQSSVSRQSLDSDLSALAGSADYTCFLSEERQLSAGSNLPILGAGTPNSKGGVYDSTFVDDWLGSMITEQVTARLVDEHHLDITSEDLTVARGVLVRRITAVLGQYARDEGSSAAGCGGNGVAVLASVPKWFAAEQTRAEADQDALDAHAAGAGLSSSGIAAYFARHHESFERDCLDAIIVKTSSAATRVESALAHGTSFALEAETASLTAETGSEGGSEGCGLVAGSFLATSVDKVAVGGVTPPVSGDGYYWVVKLASRTAVSLASVRASVVTAIVDAGQGPADAQLTAALRSSNVGVDPRYGEISPHHVTLVLGAPSPPPGAELSASANRPTLTTASS